MFAENLECLQASQYVIHVPTFYAVGATWRILLIDKSDESFLLVAYAMSRLTKFLMLQS